MPINKTEANRIAKRVAPIFQQVLGEYDSVKYPTADYARFGASFGKLNASSDDIQTALIWKWGHWGKAKFPERHRDLIAEVQDSWPSFVSSGISASPAQTFEWWRRRINRQTAYITVAFVTHLVHHNDVPIIDQHNFRAMNFFIGCLRPGIRAKKKPSNWDDILRIKSFMAQVLAAMPSRSLAELDRFLMMYGRNYAPR